MSSADAFRVLAKAVSDPARAGHPLVSVAVWSKLKALRGQSISDQRLERLGVEVENVDRAAIEQAALTQRIRTKTREHAQRCGYTGPAPLIIA